MVVLDDTYEPGHAIERLKELTSMLPSANLVFLTIVMDRDHMEAAFKAGADAVISKVVHPVSLATLLREISHDNVVHAPRHRPAQAATGPSLTARELEILKLVAQGYTNRCIARELWLTERTIKFHLSNTYRKLDVANRTEATRYAYQHGLIGDAPAANAA
jgi:DNA-binding NarL/FixJ family response regulator